jgi:hypothetical protein
MAPSLPGLNQPPGSRLTRRRVHPGRRCWPGLGRTTSTLVSARNQAARVPASRSVMTSTAPRRIAKSSTPSALTTPGSGVRQPPDQPQHRGPGDQHPEPSGHAGRRLTRQGESQSAQHPHQRQAVTPVRAAGRPAGQPPRPQPDLHTPPTQRDISQTMHVPAAHPTAEGVAAQATHVFACRSQGPTSINKSGHIQFSDVLEDLVGTDVFSPPALSQSVSGFGPGG